ncbi:MAG: DUF177 domain-containing protein [Pseudomonadota bacterium]
MIKDGKIPLATLSADRPRSAVWEPGRDTERLLAERLGLSDLRKLRAQITLTPLAGRDWHLRAKWGATVTQPCVLTLSPVTTRLEETGERTFTDAMPEITELEAQMPDDETLEPLAPEIEVARVVQEMIALAVPLYPRADDTELGEAVYGPPGEAPLTEEAARPFAGLRELRDKLAKDEP